MLSRRILKEYVITSDRIIYSEDDNAAHFVAGKYYLKLRIDNDVMKEKMRLISDTIFSGRNGIGNNWEETQKKINKNINELEDINVRP